MDRPHYKFWPKRLPHSLTPARHLAVGQPRHQRAPLPGKPALVFFGRVLQYADLQRQAERLAARLHAWACARATACCSTCRTARSW
jgi:fatty-acyl-CoA synthase